MRQLLLPWLCCLCFSAAFFSASALLARPTGGAVFSDTIRPTITCPASVTLSIPNGACEVEHFYTVMASDNEPGVQVIQTSGLASGSSFPAGQTVNSFLASDLAGNTASCTFRVTATYPNTSLVCKGEAVVNLGTSCTLTLSSTLLLEPGLPYACAANYNVEVDRTPPYGNGPWVPGTLDANDVNKTYQYRVTDKITGTRCSGNIKPKDDKGPNLLCPQVNVSCAVGTFTPAYLRDSVGLNDAFPQPADDCG
ncbi:MAG TPA: HYR domain-containing protein, partial [Saprospiraceae bacterium]|nr:HYR domain-containing protein [Saprospiraceae bacterium]